MMLYIIHQQEFYEGGGGDCPVHGLFEGPPDLDLPSLWGTFLERFDWDVWAAQQSDERQKRLRGDFRYRDSCSNERHEWSCSVLRALHVLYPGSDGSYVGVFLSYMDKEYGLKRVDCKIVEI